MPAITWLHADVDQRQARELVWVFKRPAKSPGDAEVVQHEMRALDAQALQQRRQMPRVAGNGIVEAFGLRRVAEARHIGREDARERRDARHEIEPVGAEAGVAVQADDRLLRRLGSGRDDRRRDAADVQNGPLHPVSPPAPVANAAV